MTSEYGPVGYISVDTSLALRCGQTIVAEISPEPEGNRLLKVYDQYQVDAIVQREVAKRMLDFGRDVMDVRALVERLKVAV